MRRWTIPVAVAGGMAVAVVGVLVAGRSAPAPAGAQAATTSAPTATRTITVDAVGSATGRPDQATISMGVQVERPTAQAALADASARATTLINTLKGKGVAEDDITTTNVSLWPRTDNDGKAVLGYTASSTVSAVIHDVDKAGSVIDAVAATTGDDLRLNGVSFSIADTKPLAAKARQDAVAQAKTQAASLASAAGVQLGSIVAVSTAAYDFPQPVTYEARAADSAAGAMPLQPGTQDVTAHVTVVFQIAGG